MNPAALVTRLSDQCPLLKTVGGCVDFAAAKQALKNKLPAAYLIPLAESASRNTSATMVVSQQVVQQFGVVIAVSNLRDSSGEKALADLYQVRSQIIGKLLGWIPQGERSSFEFAGGNLLDMDDQVVWWQDNWAIDTYLRSV